jgi:hypothetical protein
MLVDAMNAETMESRVARGHPPTLSKTEAEPVYPFGAAFGLVRMLMSFHCPSIQASWK